MSNIPSNARVVIIGGGVIGTSVAYHLAKMGWTDLLLLERRQLACGTTWHAAGLIAQLRATHNMTKLAKYSQELYWTLGEETGVETGFTRNGSITAALTTARMEEISRQASMARAFGVEVEEISTAEVKDRYPYLETHDVVGGVYLPLDGQADPSNVTQSLAKGARNLGAQIIEGVQVTGIDQADGRVTGVRYDVRGSAGEGGEGERGRIACDFVVNCAGMWGRQVGELAGVRVPLHAAEHFYIVTESIPGMGKLPVLRVPDECAYYKEDAGKILLGAFEPNAKPWAMDGIPEDFCFDELPEDFDHFEPILAAACERMPILAETGIHTFFNGPESFTPDDRYLLGEAPELRNFFVAAGFNSVGIQSAGGAGKALAEWIVGGDAPFDLWDVDIRRMQPFQANRTYLFNRTKESLGLLYADHYPYKQPETARGIRRSPVHELLKAKGACFGETAGWERANWFDPAKSGPLRMGAEAPAPAGPPLKWQRPTPGLASTLALAGDAPAYAYSWKRQNWFDLAAKEHAAVRNDVGVFDLSSFGKIRVEGRDACAFLNRLCGGQVDVPAGKIVYTQLLNARGGIEADLTVNRLSETAYILVTPAATVQRDLAWMRKHMQDEFVVVTDVTAAEAAFAVMGPNSRALLQRVSPADFSNEAFPFGTHQPIDIGMGLARAHRVTYVGELGWEIYVSADMAGHVFETLLDQRPTLAGLHVLDSCRIEKAYRHFGHDITDEDHVLEAGLGFAVDTSKPAFNGREAVLTKKQAGLNRRLIQVQLKDPEPLLYHNEPLVRDGEIVGFLTSGNYGHHLGGAIGLAYVPIEPGESMSETLGSHFEVEVAGQRFEALASFKPLYDPKAERPKL